MLKNKKQREEFQMCMQIHAVHCECTVFLAQQTNLDVQGIYQRDGV